MNPKHRRRRARCAPRRRDVAGRCGLSIGEIKDRVGLHELPEDDRYHTLAGFIMAELGRVPREGDKLTWNG